MSFSPLLRIPQIAANQAQKEVTANDAFIAVEDAMNRRLSIDLSAGSGTVTVSQFTRNFYFMCSGHAVNRDLTVPVGPRMFLVSNTGTGTVTVSTGAGPTYVVPAGAAALLYAGEGTVGVQRLLQT